ncbi:MAG: T9SS type A sorting domain-containing protein, partial [Calditrichaeota bacterium]|nr:T9SS type A sorting domain-containing protein [Calditrichota bacterium]
TPGYLLDAVRANRARGVMGEALFFYEGLRQRGDLLADTLRATVYSEPAQPPHRGESVWRPPALIVHEDDATTKRTGTWEQTTAPGYRGKALFHRDTSYAAVEYEFDIPASAWYHVLAFIVTGTLTTDRARFSVYSASDTSIHVVSQRGYLNAGWHRLRSAYLNAGRQTVLKLDNHGVLPGDFIVADATMIMVDRKRSPEAVFTRIPRPDDRHIPRSLCLSIYPNPAHDAATLLLDLPHTGEIAVTVYDLLGRQVFEALPGHLPPGQHSLRLPLGHLPSGLYFCRVCTAKYRTVTKLLLAR